MRSKSEVFPRPLRQLKPATTVILTERGTDIAVIRPLPSAEDPEAIIERLQATGFLSAAPKSNEPMPPFKSRCIRGEPISMTLRKMRDERN